MLAPALGRATAMARVPAGLPAGIRLSDHISLGVIAATFPPDRVPRVFAETGRASERERDLPAHVMVHYVIALALYTSASTREVLRCLRCAGAAKVAGRRRPRARPERTRSTPGAFLLVTRTHRTEGENG